MLTGLHHASGTPIQFPATPARAADCRSPLASCFANAPARQFKADMLVFSEGDQKSSVYLLESGCIMLCKISGQGSRQIVGFAFPGHFIALEAGSEHTCDAKSLGTSRLRAIPSAQLWRRAIAEPALAKEIFSALSAAVISARQHLLTIGRLSAAGRIATFLTALCERKEQNGPDRGTILLPMRRSDIADYLCLSVETVSRTLTELKHAQIISLRGWRLVKLLNRCALKDLAAGAAEFDGASQLREAA